MTSRTYWHISSGELKYKTVQISTHTGTSIVLTAANARPFVCPIHNNLISTAYLVGAPRYSPRLWYARIAIEDDYQAWHKQSDDNPLHRMNICFAHCIRGKATYLAARKHQQSC